MKFLCLTLSILALAFVGCATADNPQKLGGVTISGSCVFMDVGAIAKHGDNAAASHQTPTNDIRASVPVNTGASGLADAGAAIVERVTRPQPPAPQPVPAPQPQPVQPAPDPQPAPAPQPVPKPDAEPISPAA